MSIRPERGPSGAVATAALRDERGAIMVMGIFMCACLVGALWYLAGIGDALLLRERVQEAADAAAFSGAALHARGMNLIVLINLVMACILGIRVALKVVQLTLVILGAIFLALSWLGLGPLGGACMEAAGELESAIGELKPFIDNALKALSKAEIGIARVAPAAACAGATQVGNRYGPLVTNMFACVSVDVVANGLPLQEGTADRLCFEAGKAFGTLVGWALPGPVGSLVSNDRFTNMVGKIVERGGAYFCDMGSGGGAPKIDDFLDDAAKEDCDHKRQEKVDKLNKADSDWTKKCDEYGIACSVFTDEIGQEQTLMEGDDRLKPERRAEVQRLKSDRDLARQDLDAFNYDQCKKESKQDLNNRVKAKNGNNNNSSQSNSGQDMTPKMVLPKWSNGLKDTQIMSWGNADLGRLSIGPRGVKVGAQKRATPDITPPIAAGFAFAQAEYFFDCSGKWNSDDCNGNKERKDNEGAMWHFKWRARMRRYNRPYTDLPTAIEVPQLIPAALQMLSRASQAKVLTLNSPRNPMLRSELLQFVKPDPVGLTRH